MGLTKSELIQRRNDRMFQMFDDAKRRGHTTFNAELDRSKQMKTVTVTVEGGNVQHVEVPPDVEVIVLDYDVDGEPDSEVELDGNGDRRKRSVWVYVPEEADRV